MIRRRSVARNLSRQQQNPVASWYTVLLAAMVVAAALLGSAQAHAAPAANPRDLFGYGTDLFFQPLTYVQWGDEWYVPYVRSGVDLIDLRARNIETLDEIEQTSLDYYASVRSLYRQSRNNEINNGASAVEDLPDF